MAELQQRDNRRREVAKTKNDGSRPAVVPTQPARATAQAKPATKSTAGQPAHAQSSKPVAQPAQPSTKGTKSTASTAKPAGKSTASADKPAGKSTASADKNSAKPAVKSTGKVTAKAKSSSANNRG